MSPFSERFITDFASQYSVNGLYQERLNEVKATMEKKVEDWNDLSAIVMLGASMDFSPKGKPLLHSIVESDYNLIVGGHIRARAARQIVDEGFTNKFIITGGTQQYNGQTISRAQTLADFMTVKYHIPQEQVVVVGKQNSGNTLGNIENTIDYFQTVLPYIENTEIGVCTADWHLGRSTLLWLLSSSFFNEHSIGITPVNADNIMKRISQRHSDFIDDFQNLPQMCEREYLELRGSKNFLDGVYKPKSQ